MQTFAPLPSFLESMRTLDKSRLGNQIWREGITLIRGGWPNHPASKMWRGHEYQLGVYLLAGCDVLAERGKEYSDVRRKIKIEMEKFMEEFVVECLSEVRQDWKPYKKIAFNNI